MMLLGALAATGAITLGSGTSDAWVGGKFQERPVVTTGRAPRMHRLTTYTAPARAKDLVLPGWNMMWDRDTDTPTQLMGPNQVASGSVATASTAESYARTFLAAHLDLLAPGASIGDFTVSVNRLTKDTRTVVFQQSAGGVKVMNAVVAFMFKNDRLSLVTNTALPNVKVNVPAARLPVSAIHAAATAWLAADGKQVAPSGVATFAGERVIVPVVHHKLQHGVDIEYRLAETVAVESTSGQAGHWDVFVDASTATAFARRSTLHYSTGTILFNVPIHDPSHGYHTVPAQGVTSTINNAQVTTDDNGVATFTGTTATVKPGLVGPLTQIINNAGALVTDTLTLASGGTVTWDQSAVENNDAQLDSFTFGATAIRFAKANYDDGNAFFSSQLAINVNENQTCNAFWDGNSLNFFISDSECENTGRISDVVYHEFGHGIHQNASAVGVDGSLGEGVADMNAMNITQDHGVGIGFLKQTPDAYLRDEKPATPKVWPQDADGEVHDEGEIIAEAYVDTRDNLIAKLGDGPGRIAAMKIYYGIVTNSPDIPDSLQPALVADDDDGDLTNGTPNQCEIQAAFGRHGLGDPSSSLGLTAPTRDNFNITVATNPTQGTCPGPTIQTATVTWRLHGGTDADVALAASGNNYTGAIPTQPDGSTVEFLVKVTLSDGTLLQFPDNKADPYYQFYVGNVTKIYCQDFETGIADWTHTGSRDDWEVGAPQGLGGDPLAAEGGTNVAGVALTTNMGLYQSNSNQTLTSPMIDLKGNTHVHLQYWRWLGVEDAFFDHATVSANGTNVWTNFASQTDPEQTGIETNHIDKEWRFQDIDLSDQTSSGKIQLAFGLDSDVGLEFGGWNIDDVCVVAVTGPSGPQCGNGIVETGETCDDGNTADGDGCSATCQTEGTMMGGGKDGGGCCSVGASPTGSAALAGLVLGLVMRRRKRAKA